MTTETMLEPFMNWQFAALCVAIISIMTLITRVMSGHPKTKTLRARAWFKSFVLTPLPWVLGVLGALVPNFLPVSGLGPRIIIGVCAGMLCGVFYSIVKRFLKDKTGVDIDKNPLDKSGDQ